MHNPSDDDEIDPESHRSTEHHRPDDRRETEVGLDCEQCHDECRDPTGERRGDRSVHLQAGLKRRQETVVGERQEHSDRADPDRRVGLVVEGQSESDPTAIIDAAAATASRNGTAALMTFDVVAGAAEISRRTTAEKPRSASTVGMNKKASAAVRSPNEEGPR